MPPVLATTVVNDGNNTAIHSGVITLETSGNGTTGPFAFASVLVDSATATTFATIKKANTTAAAGDTSLVVGINPTSNAVVASGTVTAVVSGTTVISAGAVTATLNQAGAAISTTNGLWANVMFNNAIVSASVGLPATLISGATTVGVKGASITAVAADPSLVVQFNPQSPGIIPTGTFGTPSTTVLSVQGQTTGTPVPISGPLTLSTTATPTLSTTTAYTATQVIGGIITFTSVLGSYTQGIIESITCKFNTAAMTTGLSVSIFKASPAAGTYTDHVAAAINTADVPSLIGTYRLTSPLSDLGNHAIYNLDGIAKAFQSATSNLYGVVTSLGTTITLGNLTTFSIELAVLPG